MDSESTSQLTAEDRFSVAVAMLEGRLPPAGKAYALSQSVCVTPRGESGLWSVVNRESGSLVDVLNPSAYWSASELGRDLEYIVGEVGHGQR